MISYYPFRLFIKQNHCSILQFTESSVCSTLPFILPTIIQTYIRDFPRKSTTFMFESYINVIVVFDIIHKKGTEVSFKLQFSCGLKMATKNQIADCIIMHDFITKLRSFISRCLPVSKYFISKRLNITYFVIRWKTNLKLQVPFKL